MHDWDLKTNIDGIYAAGDQLFGADCCGYACSTGYYAARKAVRYIEKADLILADPADVAAEKERLYAPMYRQEGVTWKELNFAISKAMQNYCGGIKCKDLLTEGLDLLSSYRKEIVPQLYCFNPHDLMRTHEVLDILDVSEMILQACLLRESSSKSLCFERSDFPEMDPEKDRRFITVRQENGKAVGGSVKLDYFGDLEKEYEKRNQDYIAGGDIK